MSVQRPPPPDETPTTTIVCRVCLLGLKVGTLLVLSLVEIIPRSKPEWLTPGILR